MNPQRKIHIKQSTYTRAKFLDSRSLAGNTTRTLFLNMFSLSKIEDNQTTKYWREKRAQMLRLQQSSTVNSILTLISITPFADKPAGVLISWLFQMTCQPRDDSGTWSPLLSLTNKFTRVNKQSRPCELIDTIA